MVRLVRAGAALVCLAWAGAAGAQETPSAKATRKRLDTKVSVVFKDERVKDIMEELKGQLDGRLGYKIDNASGISNNTKLSYSAKDKTVGEILNELADKLEAGWYVVSAEKDRLDGWVILRKSKFKERGYEEGKGPKEKSSLPPAPPSVGQFESPRPALTASRRP